ncbi:alpha/beta fold hydrolase [Ulvibacterium marinum]|uniref:Alpha/beta hydrolase n=1 Tax=Ulvibacterium marinum TaxID=2419782 RepID=A0A3B0CI13_9FLAO|nr:alpha/beta hydrolase [Ulvibacterium marinum]RKN83536.1 alpha/beta hydrolase [Ulvibacterium marinum]
MRDITILIFAFVSLLPTNAQNKKSKIQENKKENVTMSKSKTIKINEETLSYLDNENGKITLLFLHGAFINKDYWDEQLSYFAKDFRVIAVDLPGHGDSSFNQKEYTGERFGKDISTLIKKLALKNVIIIGHSFGSDVMLETVALNASEIIGLIEIDHLKNVGMELPKEAVDQIVAGLNTDFEATCEQFAKQALLTEATNPEIVARLLNDYKRMNPEFGIPLLEYNFGYARREAELLKGLELKLNSVHVNYTPTNEESLKTYLGDNYKLHIMEGTCHYPMLENPKELNTLLETIISKI